MSRSIQLALGTALCVLGLVVVTPSCSDPDKRDPGPCDTDPPATGCGEPCDAQGGCPAGFYCGDDDKCTADCTADGTGCADNEVCASGGRCVPKGSSTDGSAGADTVCADIEVAATRVTPTIILVVDKSGSMNADFSGGKSRWDVVRETLIDPDDGIVPPLVNQVRFGLALYTATDEVNEDYQPAVGECPRLDLTPPDRDNLKQISDGYMPISWRGSTVVPRGASIGWDTPTGDAIDGVVKWLKSEGELPSPTGDPVVLLLATDGAPDRCEACDPQNTPEARKEVVDAVTAAYKDHGVTTYALFVGSATTSIKEHMNDVAEAGHGNDSFYEATDATALQTQLGAIIQGQVTCDLKLDGEIPELEDACDGTVRLDGIALECGTDWKATSTSTIEILGTACDELKAGKELTATFPCGGIVLY